jgi:hypothetical protein
MLRRPGRVLSSPRGGRGGPGGLVRDADWVQVEPVGRLLDEQEQQLVAAVEPVTDRFGHGVGFVPDDRVAQDPPVVLEGEGRPPRQAEEVLRRPGGVPVCSEVAAEIGVQAGGASPVGGVRVAEVEPARAVVGQDAARLRERASKGVDVGGRVLFVSVLPGHAVIAFAPVGRAGNDAISRPAGHLGQHLASVAHVERARRVTPIPGPGMRRWRVDQGLSHGAAPGSSGRASVRS